MTQETSPLPRCPCCGHLLQDGDRYFTDEAGELTGCEWCLAVHFT